MSQNTNIEMDHEQLDEESESESEDDVESEDEPAYHIEEKVKASKKFDISDIISYDDEEQEGDGEEEERNSNRDDEESDYDSDNEGIYAKYQISTNTSKPFN
jgi:hypothetical protein